MVHIQLYAHIQRESDIGIHSHKYRKTEIHTQRKTDSDTHTHTPKERHTDIDRIGYLVVLVSNDLVTTRTVGCCECLCKKNWNRGIHQQQLSCLLMGFNSHPNKWGLARPPCIYLLHNFF